MGTYEIAVVGAYLLLTAYLGYLGFKHTRTSADYLVGGRQMHPVIMALSYGSTFISTSAIVGFGGMAAMFGMSLLWLVFLNIFVGIFIAFVFLGEPTRRMAHRLGAHTFPELMGMRFQSRFIHVFAGLIIFLFMPLYTTAVLLGGAEFMQVMFHIPDFYAALFILAFIVAAYVLAGGLKGVMYTDALQSGIMVAGMVVLISITYGRLGGVWQAHETLTGMDSLVPESLRAIGHRGWTRFPEGGWGSTEYNLWWLIASTIILGVGVGVLAQPQLIVRFMTVKSKRELNRAVAVGGLFILLLPGGAYTVGVLTNVYFRHVESIECRVLDENAMLAPGAGGLLTPLDADPSDEVRAKAKPFVAYRLPGESADRAPHYILRTADMRIERGAAGALDILRPGLISAARSIGLGTPENGNLDKIVPTYVESAMPRWFGVIFLLTLLSAAMSTLSGQFHAMGTALARDLVGALRSDRKTSDRAAIRLMRISIIIGLVASILLGAKPLRGYIAVATALFFGLCAASFLPTLLGALFWRRMTPAGAIASMAGGFVASGTWMLFFFEKTAKGIGLCQALTGKPVLLESANWPVVDPLLVGLPVSATLAVAVSLLTKPLDATHVARCFAAAPAPEAAPKYATPAPTK
jgi:SSS family solute:Na+ symporter